jgi:hypothetical protein
LSSCLTSIPPEERERADGRNGDLERAAHAGALGVADASEVGGGGAGAMPRCDDGVKEREEVDEVVLRRLPGKEVMARCRCLRSARREPAARRPYHAALRHRWEPPRRTNWRGTGRRGSPRLARGTATRSTEILGGRGEARQRSGHEAGLQSCRWDQREGDGLGGRGERHHQKY